MFGLFYLFLILAHLKHHQLFGVFELQLVDCGLRLCLLDFVVAFAEVEQRHLSDNTHIVHAAELVLEAVETRRVGHDIISEDSHRRQEIGTGDVHLLVVDLCSEFQALQLRTVVHDVFFGVFVFVCRHDNIVKLLVLKRDLAVERQADALAEQHLGECETVFHLYQCELAVVEFHLNREFVGVSGHTFSHEFLHVIRHGTEQLNIVFGEFLFVCQRYNLPISLVAGDNHLLLFGGELHLGEILCVACHLVVGANLTTSVNRLLHRYHTSVHVVCVEVKFLGNLLSDCVESLKYPNVVHVVNKVLECFTMVDNISHIGVLHQRLDDRVDVTVDIALNSRTHGVDGVDFVVAQQLDRLFVIHVRTLRCELRQIVRKRDFFVVIGHFHLFLMDLDVIVVFKSHVTTVL